uniref:Uncharacterized protein n=1 Tax=Romanomermis culicivorax TaxID=13658 RepID=A0A915IWH2_ROMCU
MQRCAEESSRMALEMSHQWPMLGLYNLCRIKFDYAKPQKLACDQLFQEWLDVANMNPFRPKCSLSPISHSADEALFDFADMDQMFDV